jgi:hypothetical protein
MRRFVALRLLFALLALLTVSTDTAMKLMHGIEHMHERSHAMGAQPPVTSGEHVAGVVTVPDDEGEHGALHAGAPAGVPLQPGALLPPAVPVTVPPAVVVVRVASVPAPVARARPPSADRAPARLRAPPVG